MVGVLSYQSNGVAFYLAISTVSTKNKAADHLGHYTVAGCAGDLYYVYKHMKELTSHYQVVVIIAE